MMGKTLADCFNERGQYRALFVSSDKRAQGIVVISSNSWLIAAVIRNSDWSAVVNVETSVSATG